MSPDGAPAAASLAAGKSSLLMFIGHSTGFHDHPFQRGNNAAIIVSVADL